MFIVVFFCYLFTVVVNITDGMRSVCEDEKQALDHREVADDRRDIMQSVCEADRDTSDAGAVELADEDLDNTEPDSDESCGSRELFGDISEDDSNGIGYEDLNDVMCPLSQVYLSCKP